MNRNGSIRWMSVAIGGWLIISAFLWMHTQAQFTNTWLVGLASAATALMAMRVPQLRFVNVLLAIWLFASLWALPIEMQATFWNNLIAAVVLFFAALTPETSGTRGSPFQVGTH